MDLSINKVKSKYLEFKLVGQKPKTQVWQVLSKHYGDVLATIKWYAPWRQYCFFPESEILFNATCLSDIIGFLKELNEHHKKKKILEASS